MFGESSDPIEDSNVCPAIRPADDESGQDHLCVIYTSCDDSVTRLDDVKDIFPNTFHG